MNELSPVKISHGIQFYRSFETYLYHLLNCLCRSFCRRLVLISFGFSSFLPAGFGTKLVRHVHSIQYLWLALLEFCGMVWATFRTKPWTVYVASTLVWFVVFWDRDDHHVVEFRRWETHRPDNDAATCTNLSRNRADKRADRYVKWIVPPSAMAGSTRNTRNTSNGTHSFVHASPYRWAAQDPNIASISPRTFYENIQKNSLVEFVRIFGERVWVSLEITYRNPIYNTISSFAHNRNYSMVHRKHNTIDIAHASWHRLLASGICREFCDRNLRTIHKFSRILLHQDLEFNKKRNKLIDLDFSHWFLWCLVVFSIFSKVFQHERKIFHIPYSYHIVCGDKRYHLFAQRKPSKVSIQC